MKFVLSGETHTKTELGKEREECVGFGDEGIMGGGVDVQRKEGGRGGAGWGKEGSAGKVKSMKKDKNKMKKT